MTDTARGEPTTPPDLTPAQLRRGLSPFRGSFRTLTVGMVALIGLSAFESLAVATAMPWVAGALNGMGLYAMAFGGPLASGVIGMTAAGSWADRRGPVRPLLLGVALFVAGLLVAGFAPTMLVLVTGRVVQGIGSGMLIVALYVVVAQVYPEAMRARVFAAFAGAWVVPGIVGPGLAGLVVEHLGWRWVFLGVAVLSLPAVLVLRPALTGMPTRGNGTQDPSARRRTFLSVAAAAGVLALHHGGQVGGVARACWLVAGLAALGASLPALLPAGTLRSRRGLPTVIGLRGLLSAAYFGAEVFVPLLLTSHRGLSAAAAGAFLTATAVAWAGGSALRGRVTGWSDPALLRAASAGVLIGIGTVALILVPGFPLGLAFLGWCFAGFGMGVGIPTLSLLTLRGSSPEQQGANSSALQVVDAVTAATSLALSGALFVVLGGPTSTASFAVVLAIAATTGLLSLALSGRVIAAPHRGDKADRRP